MSLIPKVKCSRCDKSYSGLKNKCPYCGASRGRSGKRAADTRDNTARFMIKMLLLLALVVTVISMLVIDFDSEPTGGTILATPPPTVNQTNGEGEGGEVGPDGTVIATPIPTATPAPTPTPVEATSLGIRWQFWAEGASDMTIPVGTVIELWAQMFPTDATGEPSWSTSASTVANFTVNHEDHRRIELEARSVGVATISVTVDGLESEIIVRVR